MTRRTWTVGGLVAVIVAVVAAINYFRTPKLERAGAIEALLPSVVRITTHSMVKDDKAGRQAGRHEDPGASVPGFIIDKAGYVATNRHVIKNAYEIIVRLNDGSPVRAN